MQVQKQCSQRGVIVQIRTAELSLLYRFEGTIGLSWKKQEASLPVIIQRTHQLEVKQE